VNVLFVLYSDFRCNSATHIDGIARQLLHMGCDCLVAVPSRTTYAEVLGSIPYKTATFEQIEHEGVGFDDKRSPDIVHLWTPREINRGFWSRLQRQHQFATIIHMEDNEQLITASQLGGRYQDYCYGRATEGFPDHLSHPINSRQLLEAADGITIIIETLTSLIPSDKPCAVLWPSSREEMLYPRPINWELRKELELDPNAIVLSYHGNMHSANFREIRSLYLAVALLNREGQPAVLLRAGTDYVNLSEYRDWTSQFVRYMGYIPYTHLAPMLSAADLFVQPGRCDDFNKYRFPSKVPDFFAMGRPVILPRTNIGLVTRHLQDAYVLDEADGPAIADGVKMIMSNKWLYEKLALGAREFFTANLNWPTTAGKTLALYKKVLKGRTTGTQTNGLLDRYNKVRYPPLSYATVRDYCDSSDHLGSLCVANDLKDVQRPWSVKAIIGLLKPGATLLEIGAGEPLAASFLHTLGWQVIVCDPYDGSGNGPTAYDSYLRAYPQVQIMRSPFNRSVASRMQGQIDAVYSISVLEHILQEDLEEVFCGIRTALKPGGWSIHCADAVIQGPGTEFHLDQMARILHHQNSLAGTSTSWSECQQTVAQLFDAAAQDIETFFLGPQGHNLWRGTMPYAKFPFRRCISVQSVVQCL
jgi:glycosyltransferase involved in cell wall biosynthesis